MSQRIRIKDPLGQVVATVGPNTKIVVDGQPFPATHPWLDAASRGVTDNADLDAAGYTTELYTPPFPPPPSAEEAEATRVAAIQGQAEALISKYVDSVSWTEINDRLMLRMDRVIKQYAQLVDKMATSATWADFITAANVVSGGKTHFQKVADNTALVNNLYANMNPIKTWIDNVRSHAADLIADPQMTADWGSLEAQWNPLWNNVLNRFA